MVYQGHRDDSSSDSGGSNVNFDEARRVSYGCAMMAEKLNNAIDLSIMNAHI